MKRLSMAMTALAVMGLMTMVSCRKPNVNNVVPGAARTVTFNATTESNGGSKTYLEGLDVKWSADDQISVNGNDANHTLTLEDGVGTTFGRFTGTITAAAPYLVGYPADATNTGSNITFTIPAEQNIYNNGSDYDLKGVLPMAAHTTDENADLQFKNMVNVLKLDLTGSEDITKIEVKSAAENLSGNFTVNSGLVPTAINAGTITKKITITKGMTLTGTSQTVYVVLPVFGNAESTVTVKFTGDDGVMTVGPKSLTGSNTPNHRYNAPVAVNLVAPKPAPTSVTTTAGCNSELIYTMGGTVTLDEGAAQEVEYGFVCSESVSAPTVGTTNCFKVVGGTADMEAGTTSFTVDITGLTVGTPYYVRAYAIGESGTAVHATGSGSVKTIIGGDAPQTVNWNGDGTQPGASPKEFTVGNQPDMWGDPHYSKVRFSQGNLQYIGSAATPYWKFADHQFDFLGTTGQDSDSQTVDRDLFGWGTSGHHQSTDTYNTNYMPYSTSTTIVNETYNKYGYGPSTNVKPDGPWGLNRTPGNISGSYYDWGVKNTIDAGGTATTGWRTLTKAEWDYLLSEDNNSKWALGRVGSSCTPGLIILPDEWTSCPTGCNFTGGVKDFSTNVYSYTQWHDMESAGAVFLPAAGFRGTPDLSHLGSYGSYWSSSYYLSAAAYGLLFYSGAVSTQDFYYRYYGLPVRLVR